MWYTEYELYGTNAAPEFALRTRGIRAQRDCVGAANFRVCGTRYCPARTAARGDQLRPQVPPCGAHWPFNLWFLILQSGSGGAAHGVSRGITRVHRGLIS